MSLLEYTWDVGRTLIKPPTISSNMYLLGDSVTSTPIREVFSLGLRDLIRLLTSIELFQPISFI